MTPVRRVSSSDHESVYEGAQSASSRQAGPVAGKKRGSETVRDMVLSLLVVGAAIGLFVVLLPKTPHAKVTQVDYLTTARAVASDTKLPIMVPSPLPAGWQSNYVRVGVADSLHIGFVLNANTFAQLDETADPNAAFYADAKVRPTPGGATAADTATAAAAPAGYLVRRQGGHVALVRQLSGGGILTISDGGTSSGANLSQLVTLAKSVRQISPST